MWHEDVPQIIATRDVIGWFSHGRLCPFTSAPITPIKTKFKLYLKEEQANPHKTAFPHTNNCRLSHTTATNQQGLLSQETKLFYEFRLKCIFISDTR